MEQILTAQILKALEKGNFAEFIVYLLIFVFIWLEVRGMKKELHTLNTTVKNSLGEGELRFQGLEKRASDFDHRLTKLEKFTTETHNRLYELETQQTKDGKHENNSIN